MSQVRPGLLSALLKANYLKGALRWKIDLSDVAFEQEVAQSGMQGWLIDTTGAKSKSDVMSMIARQLDFPDFFNGNFDSLEECLGNLNQAQPAFIVWRGWEGFVRESKDDARVIGDIFDTASTLWPGAVLFVGRTGDFPDIGELAQA